MAMGLFAQNRIAVAVGDSPTPVARSPASQNSESFPLLLLGEFFSFCFLFFSLAQFLVQILTSTQQQVFKILSVSILNPREFSLFKQNNPLLG